MRTTRTEDHGIQISGFIEAPPRTSFAGTIIVLSVIAALSTTLTLPAAFNKWTLAVLAGLVSSAMFGRAVYAVHAALLD